MGRPRDQFEELSKNFPTTAETFKTANTAPCQYGATLVGTRRLWGAVDVRGQSCFSFSLRATQPKCKSSAREDPVMRLDALLPVLRNPYFRSLPVIRLDLHVRQQERLMERARIAQELQGTVLQTLCDATLKLQGVLDGEATNSPAKLSLGRVLAMMERILEDARLSIRKLHSTNSESPELAELLARVPQELEIELKTNFRVTVLGSSRRMHPDVEYEAYHIGREALINAFRHSGASQIQAELEYGIRRFVLRVRDNGGGIDPQVLRSGRDGHWGLVGMRERAERIGARLRVHSRIGAGTELELSIPRRVAFGHHRKIGKAE